MALAAASAVRSDVFNCVLFITPCMTFLNLHWAAFVTPVMNFLNEDLDRDDRGFATLDIATLDQAISLAIPSVGVDRQGPHVCLLVDAGTHAQIA